MSFGSHRRVSCGTNFSFMYMSLKSPVIQILLKTLATRISPRSSARRIIRISPLPHVIPISLKGPFLGLIVVLYHTDLTKGSAVIHISNSGHSHTDLPEGSHVIQILPQSPIIQISQKDQKGFLLYRSYHCPLSHRSQRRVPCYTGLTIVPYRSDLTEGFPVIQIPL